jgi:putative acetyltransferase
MSVIVRLEEPGDRDASILVEGAAFGSTEEPAIVEAVRDEPGSFALVAEDAGEVVGHVQFSRATVGRDPVVALGPIAVRSDRQGRKIGRALVEAGLAEARSRGESAVILLGSPDLYPRFGFEPASTFGLRNPFAGVSEGDFVVAEEDFMLAPLDERAHSLAGRVRWHAVFGQPG